MTESSRPAPPDLIRDASVEELREAAEYFSLGPVDATRERRQRDSLAAAALSLITEGRESGAFARVANYIDIEADDGALLNRLAGTP